MKKCELTISSSYVPNWTIFNAIRELVQNALDQEFVDANNTMNMQYDEDKCELTISNKNSSLTTNTLLFGSTSKANDENQIGQFGEGYKIATMVLLREGKNITFYNYGAKERNNFV